MIQKCIPLFLAAGLGVPAGLRAEPAHGIRVVDPETGGGVPLVELRSVSDVSLHTDSSGWVAVADAAFLNRTVYFHVSSPGYAAARDGFGFSGVRVEARPGGETRVELPRTQVARRICRLTGEAIHGHAVALGREPLRKLPLLNAGVTGQDSAQAVRWRDGAWWFWGDTNLQRYPLGHFGTAAAWLPSAPDGRIDLVHGAEFAYVADEQGQSRPVWKLDGPGPVWVDGVAVVPDGRGRDHLVCHYSRMKSLAERVEHGLGLWNGEARRFEKRLELPAAESWRFPAGQAVRFEEGGRAWLGFANPLVTVRVPATLEAVLEASRYEAWTESGWQAAGPPLKPAHTSLQPRDAHAGKPVTLHSGSVRWNPFLRAWLAVAVQHFGDSVLGEVWISAAPDPTGPWLTAVKVATHGGYSFYNPVHHDFADAEGGRLIHFEGTFTKTFSARSESVPRYEYNQLLYQVDLADPRLAALKPAR